MRCHLSQSSLRSIGTDLAPLQYSSWSNTSGRLPSCVPVAEEKGGGRRRHPYQKALWWEGRVNKTLDV